MKKADIKIGHYYRTKTNEIVVVRKIESKPTVYQCINSETKKKSKFSVGTAFIEEVTESSKVTRVTKKEDKLKLSHVLIKAFAGTGKTTTLIQMLKMLRGDDPCCLEKNGKVLSMVDEQVLAELAGPWHTPMLDDVWGSTQHLPEGTQRRGPKGLHLPRSRGSLATGRPGTEPDRADIRRARRPCAALRPGW